MRQEQKEKIITLRRRGFGYADIERELGISRNTVKSFCRRNGLGVIQEHISTEVSDRCRECGKPLIQKDKQKKRVFCCRECREKWWKAHPDRVNRKAVYSFTCACCGKAFMAYGNSHRKYCCHECYIRDRFGGGRHE